MWKLLCYRYYENYNVINVKVFDVVIFILLIYICMYNYVIFLYWINKIVDEYFNIINRVIVIFIWNLLWWSNVYIYCNIWLCVI